jgi:hypothetical protein
VSTRFVPPPPEVVAEMRQVAERPLGADEFNALINAPMSEFEREEIESLIAWFMRRYPTPAARLACQQRAYAQARKRMPPER